MRPVLAPVFLHTLRLLLSLATCSWGPAVAYPFWSSSDDLVHLYTSSSRKAYFLQLNLNGRVDGTLSPTVYSTVVIKAISPGLVRIIGVMSKLSLCMRNDGQLYGSASFINDDCVFKHILLETRYDIYESVRYKFLVSLGKAKGILDRNQNLPHFSQFLTRRNDIPLSQFNTPLPQPQPEVTPNSGEDPCGGILDGRIPEEVPLVNGIHPCFIEDDIDDGTVMGRFPRPRIGKLI